MVKKKILFLVLLTLLIACLFLISGCFEKKECKASIDCPAKECKTAQCTQGKCVYNTVPNCCGNRKCESSVGENKCSCVTDCGNCSGKAEYTDPATNKVKETKYLSYTCTLRNDCVLDSERKTEQFFKEKVFTYFTIGITSSFEQPFDVTKSPMVIKFDLEDVDEKLVFPIKFTAIKVLDRQSKVLGETEDMDKELNKVGDSFEQELSLPYGTDVLEEEKYVTVRINYEYAILEKTGTDDEGEPIYAPSDTKRDSYEYQFSNKLIFVNSQAK